VGNPALKNPARPLYERALPLDERAFESNHVAQRVEIVRFQRLGTAPVEILEACGQLMQPFDNASQFDDFHADAVEILRTPLCRDALRHSRRFCISQAATPGRA